MHTLDAVLVVPFALVFLYALFIWVFYPLSFFTVGLYRHVRYTQKGLCPKCHRPAAVRTRPADQLYGPDQTSQLMCSCGPKGFKMGNRRFADW